MSENMKDKIVETIQAEFSNRYGTGKRKEVVTSMKDYKSLPITTASNENEVGFVLQDVVLVSKLKELPNGEVVPVYELFGENGAKILETQDDGLMKFDREIFDDLIKDKIKAIEESGYEVASIDMDGKIDSFFEMINGKVIAINREQKERLDRGSNKEALRESIDGETANPELDEDKAKDNPTLITARTILLIASGLICPCKYMAFPNGICGKSTRFKALMAIIA